MNVDARWWFVSDLHLGPDQPGPRRTAAAFADFLDAVVRSDDSPLRHVVLLGDTFDLGRSIRADGVAAEMEAVAARGPDLFRALRTCVADGVAVDFVCGNHDAALAQRPARTALGRLVCGEAPNDRVRVHPWILYVPGVFYAEHGHQHHAVHRQPTILGTGLVRTPLAAWTERSETGGSSVPARTGAVLRATGALRHAERAVLSPTYVRLLDDEAARLGLPSHALRALARVSRFRVLPAAAGVAGRALAHSLGRDRPGTYLQAAVTEVHRTLTEYGCAVPWYLFGHTHRAACTAVEASDSCYLNAGTWSADVRGHGPDAADRTLFPFAVIEASGARVYGSVRYWRRPPDGQWQRRSPSSANSLPSLTTKRQRYDVGDRSRRSTP